MRHEVLGRQVGLAALLAASACGPSAGPRATATATIVEITTPGTAAVVVDAPPAPRASASAKVAAAESIPWMTDEREARERARRQGLPLLVWARASWAVAAVQMERKTWADPRVVRAARGFVALRLDLTDVEGDSELLAQRYAVDTMPATIVVDASGRQIAVVRGFSDADALLAALARAAP